MFIYHDAKEKGECMDIKDLAISGKDLINIGFREGKRIGEVLELLLETTIQQPDMNTKEKLLSLASLYI